MTQALKRLLILLGLLPLLAVAGLFLLTRGLNAAVKSGIETVGSEATATPVTVAGVGFSLFSGTGDIRGLTIDNPDGFDTDHALAFDRIAIALDVGSLRSDVVMIHEITIDGAHLIAEQKLFRTTNLRAILDDIRDFAALDDETEWDLRFVVEAFHVTNAEVTLHAPLLANRRLELPDVHLRDLGHPALGVSVPEMPLRILEPIIAEVLKSVQRRTMGF